MIPTILLAEGSSRRFGARKLFQDLDGKPLIRWTAEALNAVVPDHLLVVWRPVVREVAEKFLACGILDHGFARVRCAACAHEYLLAFSCKARYFCPSRRVNSNSFHIDPFTPS